MMSVMASFAEDTGSSTIFGDINGDGTADLAFVRTEGLDTVVRVVFGGPVATADSTNPVLWPRTWGQNLLDILDKDNSRTITLGGTTLAGDVSLQMLSFDSDQYADLLIVASGIRYSSLLRFNLPKNIPPGSTVNSVRFEAAVDLERSFLVLFRFQVSRLQI